MFPFDKKPMTSQQLTDITRGMYHAAAATSNMIANQYLYLLDQFFDKNDEGGLDAKMVRVDMTDDTYMMVPLVSMVAPKGLALEQMKVNMSVKIDESDITAGTHEFDDCKATRSSFKVELSPKDSKYRERRASDIIDIEMTFSAGDAPEGINKIIDEYMNLIEPLKVHDGSIRPSGTVDLSLLKQKP